MMRVHRTASYFPSLKYHNSVVYSYSLEIFKAYPISSDLVVLIPPIAQPATDDIQSIIIKYFLILII